MNNTSGMKTATRFGIGFASMVAIVLTLVGVSWSGLTQLDASFKTIYEDRVIPLRQLSTINALTLRNRILIQDMIMNPEAANIAKRTDEFEKNVAKVTEEWKAFTATHLTPEEKELAAQFTSARMAYSQEGLQPAMAAIKAGQIDSAKKIAQEKISPLAPPVAETLRKLTQLQVDVSEQEFKSAQATVKLDLTVLAIASVLAVLFSVGAAVYLTRWLMRQLGGEPSQAAAIAAAVAHGDLTARIELKSGDTTSLMVQLKRMQDNLVQLVDGVRTGVDSVSTASGQIAAGNQDLSSRTEEQASSLQQTAASMEQLTSTVKQSADNAKQANQLASAASEAATKGGAVVGQVVSTMEDISASSKKIADIISVIDGIAFQTNILALNAAVEAARAGEQGRGFAVVAGEVRNLAQRSAQAAREIKSLISDSVEKVEAGSKQVNDAGAAMGEIVAQVKRVTDLIGEITSAALEQSSGIGQVNEAITQMDQVTQQNAALVEESAAAAASLKEQAGKLAEAVSVFKLAQGEARSVIAGAQSSARATPMASKAKPQAKRSAPAAAPAKAAAPEAGKGKDEWEEF
jgi:methyl-accepting chemotaxis protein-1 (serine sensor receptor)